MHESPISKPSYAKLCWYLVRGVKSDEKLKEEYPPKIVTGEKDVMPDFHGESGICALKET